jgi:hypothetical protein
MADAKISALTNLTAADAINDMIPIVDVSDTPPASGNTKRISINNILGASGTATLASATITGALTVDTSTLKVDATNHRVGIGTASPSGIFHAANLGTAGTSADNFIGYFSSANRNASLYLLAKNTEGSNFYFGDGDNNTVGAIVYDHTSNYMRFDTNATERMRIDSSGNVGIGNTPTTLWRSGARALQVGLGKYVSLHEQTNGSTNLAFSNYESAANVFSYTTGDAPTRYAQINGRHEWYNAAAGTANAVITFTQAMTLDASGYLLLGTTDSGFTSGAGYKFGPGATPSNGQVGASSSNGDLTLRVYSTGAAAYRFYVGFGGTVFATNTAISAISDARLKENVKDIDVGLSAILALKPRTFDWKAGKGKDIKGDRGFIAQEFETVFPNLIDEWADPAPEGEAPYKSVRQDLIPVLVKAIQELTARVQTLEAR